MLSINPIKNQKNSLRLILKDRLSQMTDNQKRSEDLIINKILQGKFNKKLSILCYYPLVSEPDITPSIKYWLNNDFIVSLPRIKSGEFYCQRICDLSEKSFIKSNLGVFEPSQNLSSTNTENNLDVIIVPGLGFTTCGSRLGRGGGIYDRFLSKLGKQNPTSIGICYKNQIVDSIPIEEHDRPVNLVISQ
jgi:5-formyltetrahydrofolate cyclo-ligase